MEEEKEIVWLPKSLAKKLKDNTEKSMEEELILKYIDDSKKDIGYSLESLDEDVLRFKASMIRAKNAFKEAKDEQLEANYKLWEDYDKDLSVVREKMDSLKNLIKPVREEVENLNEEINKIRVWDIKELLDTLGTISSILSYDNEQSRVIKYLFENYKPKAN